jgi:hypothetical protein
MSRGTPLTPIRLSADLVALIDAEVARQNATRADPPYNRSSWIRQAIQQRLDHLARARRRKRVRAVERPDSAMKGAERQDRPDA